MKSLHEATVQIAGDLCRGDDGRFVACSGGTAGAGVSDLPVESRPAAQVAAPTAFEVAKRKADVLAAATTAAEREHADLVAEYAIKAERSLAGGDSRDRYAVQDGVRDGFASYAWAPERRALHERIIGEAFEGVEPSENPVVVFMGGLPGAGKSTTVGKDLRLEGRVVVNADDIKAKLPEYDGSNAAYLHEESSEIAETMLAVAREMRADVVFDATMKTHRGAAQRIKDFRDAGYRVECRFVDVDVDTSVVNAVTRLVNGHKKNGKGRFVPLEVIRESHDPLYGSKPRATFERLAQENAFDAYVLVDNRNFAAREIRRYGKLTESAAWSRWFAALNEGSAR